MQENTTKTSKSEIVVGAVNTLPPDEPRGEIGGAPAYDVLGIDHTRQMYLSECEFLGETPADRRRYRIEHGL